MFNDRPIEDLYTTENAARLLAWLETCARLEHLSNAALGDLVCEHLWAMLPLGSPQSDLLAEVIARLKGERATAATDHPRQSE